LIFSGCACGTTRWARSTKWSQGCKARWRRLCLSHARHAERRGAPRARWSHRRRSGGRARPARAPHRGRNQPRHPGTRRLWAPRAVRRRRGGDRALHRRRLIGMADDRLALGGRHYTSRLIVGTGKYRDFAETRAAIEASGAEIVTVAVRRVNITDPGKENLLD